VQSTEHPQTLGELVSAQPALADLFERLGLDFCCGGRRTLAEACAEKGLDPHTVEVLVSAAPPAGERAGGDEVHDVAHASIPELCDHIVTKHHGPLRASLDRITALVAKVVRVHGADHPELHDVERVFDGARTELLEHMRVEELTLFPACRELDHGAYCATASLPLAVRSKPMPRASARW
jgi:regulator of cell morphogenesis and NO signaling